MSISDLERFRYFFTSHPVEPVTATRPSEQLNLRNVHLPFMALVHIPSLCTTKHVWSNCHFVDVAFLLAHGLLSQSSPDMFPQFLQPACIPSSTATFIFPSSHTLDLRYLGDLNF